MYRKYFIVLMVLACCFKSMGQPTFRVVPLGVLGGADEQNLSAYMIAAFGSSDYVCMDGGTIKAGIDKAIALKSFHVGAAKVLRHYIKAYCISHAHLDHVSGLIINSPADSNKTIYGLASTIRNLQQSYFNNKAWANFGDDGIEPQLKKYHFQSLNPYISANVDNTSMQVTAYPLTHINPYESTAFLLQHKENYVLYFGDTGPDSVEHSDKLTQVWQQIAPLVKAKKLKAIFIEVSFPDEQPDDKLFGHLTAKWLMKEMQVLAGYTGADKLKGFKVVVTHLKPPVTNINKIKMELQRENKLGLQIIYPVQGKAFNL